MNSTEATLALAPTRYAQRLAARKESEEIGQLTNFGLMIGWLFALLGGFCWFCVVSKIDWFWCGLMWSGITLLVLGTVLPQALYWPHRLWMGLAHLQGRLVMTVLLTVVYLALICPLGWWERRRRRGSHPFHSWDNTPPVMTTAWEALPVSLVNTSTNSTLERRSRSLIGTLVETLSFFARRGHYLLLPVLLILLLLGLVLFFVQSSALAPFIYTIGVINFTFSRI